MKHLIKADFKKITFLSGYRKFLLATIILSILFGILFLFTIDITQGKRITELSSLEVVDITLLGIDVAAIMLIIFTANVISKEFSTGAIHTSLAITPLRKKYFIAKISFIAILSLLVSIALTGIIFIMDQFILSVYNLDMLSFFDQTLIIKLIGVVMMPLFYSLLSGAASFYMQSAAGGITFSLGIMFLPALIKMFPANFSDVVLPIFPEKSLNMFSEANNGSLIYAVLILIVWILISCFLGLWKFKKANF